MNPDSDEDDKKKNNKKKNEKIKDLFKIERQYVFDKMAKKSTSYYHLFDK